MESKEYSKTSQETLKSVYSDMAAWVFSKEFNFSFDYNGLICPKCTNKNDSLALSLGEFAILSKIDANNMNNLSGLKFLSRADMVSVISLMCKDFRIMTEEEIVTIKQYL